MGKQDRIDCGGLQKRSVPQMIYSPAPMQPVSNEKIPTVAIVQQFLAHYRLPFFDKLHELLKAVGIEMRLFHGADPDRHLPVSPPEWCSVAPCRVLPGGLTWQSCFASTCNADLVICEQATKHLLNFALLARARMSRQKVAFWGHGKNFQSRNPRGVSERLKLWMTRRADWFFAYNDLSASIAVANGFPGGKITSVQNAVDTTLLQNLRSKLTDRDLAEVRRALNTTSEHLGIYTGGLYSEKRLPFLFDACTIIRKAIPDFELIVIGKGQEQSFVREAARKAQWIHYVGAKNDAEKVPYWAVSKVLLMPGLVGLVVLDSFALGVPMVTTNYPYHSPEIAYLEDNVNGVIVKPWDDVRAYAGAVADLLMNPARHAELARNGKEAAAIFTIENMAEHFAAGVRNILTKR